MTAKAALKPLSMAAMMALLLLAAASARAAPVAQRWAVETSRPEVTVIDCYHGETLALEAEVYSYGDPVDFTSATARLYWQTNGMGSAWWATNATATATNVLRATFTPAMDAGAAVVNGFIGIAEENYRVAFRLRFRHSPGATPNELPLPTATIDCAAVTFDNPTNAPWIIDLTAATNYTDAATNALGEALRERIDGKQDTLADYTTTGAVRSIVTDYGYETKAVTNGLASTGYVDAAAAGRLPATHSVAGWTLSDSSPLTVPVGIGFSSSAWLWLIGGWETLKASDDGSQQTLPDYLASTAWHGSDKSLVDYGITNAIPAPVVPDYTTNNTVLVSTITNVASGGSAPSPSPPSTESTITYKSDRTAVVVSVPAGGTLSADVTDWVVGQSQTALITIAAGASVSSGLVLVGYTEWLTGQQFIAECIYVGGKVYVNPVATVQ